MRTRTLLVVLGLLGALSGPAHAGGTGELVLSGPGTRSVEVVLRAAVTIDLQHFVPDASAAWSGLAVRDARGGVLAYVFQVRRWVKGSASPYPIGSGRALHLSPGRYRFDLLASGRATVTVPATGELGRSLRAASSAPADSVQLVDVRGPAVPVVNHRFATIDLRRGGVAILAMTLRSTAHQASTPQLCFAAPGAPSCVQTYGDTFAVTSVGGVGDGYWQTSYRLYGDDAPGPYDPLAKDLTVDLPTVFDALLLTL